MQNEIWKKYEHEDLHESQNFEISNKGRIRSLNGSEPAILKGYVNNGYLTFSTRKKNKKRTLTYVHKAVAQLFLENDDPEKYVVAHLDFNPLNNKVENLAWMTPGESEKHAYKNPAGSKLAKIKDWWKNAHPRDRFYANKLTESKVLKIKRILNDPSRKTRIKMIAKQFEVSEATIYSIQAGRSWSWLTEDYIKKEQQQKQQHSKKDKGLSPKQVESTKASVQEKSAGLGPEFLNKLKNYGKK